MLNSEASSIERLWTSNVL